MRHQKRNSEESTESSSKFNPPSLHLSSEELREYRQYFFLLKFLQSDKLFLSCFSVSESKEIMVPPNNLVIIYLSLVWTVLVFVHFDFANSRVISKHDELPQHGDCVNCHVMSPPLPPSLGSEYPLYGAPPPPASVYPSYGAPPPPDPLGQGNCTPVPPQCCRYPPPFPPNTYTYFPSDSILPAPFPTIFLVSIMMFLASFALFF